MTSIRTKSNFLLFTIGLLALFSLFEFGARVTYRTKADHVFILPSLLERAASTETIILGSSHAAEGVNPQFLSAPAINLAYSYQDIYYDQHVGDKFISLAPKLKIVIQEISFFSFGYDTVRLSPHMLSEYYFNLGIKPRWQNFPRAALYSSALWNHKDKFLFDILRRKSPATPNVQMTFAVPSINFPNDSLFLSGYRFSNTHMTESELKDSAKERASLYLSAYDEGLRESNKKALGQMIEKFTRKKIQVILITAPVTQEYKNQYSSKHLRTFYIDIDEVTQNFPEVQYYDFSRDPNFLNADFTNSDHLNFLGSSKFTHLLNELLKEEITAQQP